MPSISFTLLNHFSTAFSGHLFMKAYFPPTWIDSLQLFPDMEVTNFTLLCIRHFFYSANGPEICQVCKLFLKKKNFWIGFVFSWRCSFQSHPFICSPALLLLVILSACHWCLPAFISTPVPCDMVSAASSSRCWALCRSIQQFILAHPVFPLTQAVEQCQFIFTLC